MKIAIDFEGTLTPECGEFACDPRRVPARWLFDFSLRQGARTLLRELAQSGHTLTLYTRLPLSARRLLLWCWLTGLPITHVVTSRRLPAEAPWPPWQGQDLLLDDEPRRVALAGQNGVPGVVVTNREADWTTSIRAASGARVAASQTLRGLWTGEGLVW
jgi:hypothetical protein